jgi:ADP-glucose pyrophosphorylase
MELQTQNQLLLDFLRSELKNSHIQLVLELTKSENPKLTQLTSKEKFFQMAEKNPDLHIFKEKFNLDIEF